MLKRIKILNFKGIKSKELFFDEKLNIIIGNNGVGKTNILESIGTLFQNNFSGTFDKNLVSKGENLFYLEGDFFESEKFNTVSFSYSSDENKKNTLLNKKKVTKKILNENLLKVSYFLPITMNLFYLGPKYRRDFLDDIVLNSFEGYSTLLKRYDIVLKSRNKILKNIQEGFSKKEEIYFWDNEFIELSEKILTYRMNLIDFISNNIGENKEIFGIKVDKIKFNYISKVDLNNIKPYIKSYLEKNLERDIIIGKTQIGPHLDDFDILLDDFPIIEYASRGETKSIILCLKLLEISYIKEKTSKTPILLIDDLGSELDYSHIKILINKIGNIQTIITSISEISDIEGNNIFI